MDVRNHFCPIRRIDADKQIVYAEVYAPNELDTYGEFMFPDDVELLAHRFMELDLANVIDTNHDNVPNGSRPIESFIARAGDPDFAEGAWVMACKVSDEKWPDVLSGELNGYSFEALVELVECEVTVSIVRDQIGLTDTQKGVDHEHAYFVQVNEKGRVIRGWTDEGPDGHSHVIRHGSLTLPGGDGHTHRFELEF